jgi:4-amino-4-deoxy-L-arabinose transferase-like glycosyltransferase
MALVMNVASHERMNASGLESISRRALLGVALAAFVVKAVALFAILPMLTKFPMNATMFPDGYDLLAWNMVNGNGYRMFEDTSPTMIRTPGYVLVLAAIFAVFGKSLLPVQLANVLFSALAAVLVYDVSRRMLRSELVGVIAGVLVFLHPGTIVAESRGGLESLLMLFMALCLWLCLRALKGEGLIPFAWLGLAFGVTMLIKSSVALVLPGVAAWTVWAARRSADRRHRLIRGFAVAALVAAVCMVPWIARNALISGEFVATQTSGPVSFFQGQHVVASVPSDKDHEVLLAEAADKQVDLAREMGLGFTGYFFPQFYSVSDEVAFYSELSRRTWRAYAESPWLIVKGIGYNSIAFWVQGRTWLATAVNTVVALPLLLLVAVGYSSARRQKHDVSLLVVFAACYILPHLLIISIPRFYVPLLPVLGILAAVPLASYFRRSNALFVDSGRASG